MRPLRPCASAHILGGGAASTGGDTESYVAQQGDTAEASEESCVEQLEKTSSLESEQADELDAQALEQVNAESERGEGDSAEELFFLLDEEEGLTPTGLRLSEHFLLREFHCKDGTHVPAAAIPALKRLVNDVLEPMRTRFGRCTVHSGFRTDAYNRRVDGATSSQHLYHRTPNDVAADITFANGNVSAWHSEAERLLGNSGGLGRYATFVHVDNRAQRARW